MLKSALSILSGLISLVNVILTKVSESKIRQQGRDEVTLDSLKNDNANLQRAREIDTDVRTADLAALHERMSKYARD
jgi:hypothetical protein